MSHNPPYRADVVGSYLRNYLEGKGMTRRSKIWTLSLLWAGITLAAALATDSLLVRVVLGIVLTAVTVHILTIGEPATQGDSSELIRP